MIGANKTTPVPRGARWKTSVYSQQFTARKGQWPGKTRAGGATHSLVAQEPHYALRR